MKLTKTQKQFLKNASPIFAKPRLTKKQKLLVKPFVSNINGNPYSINMLSPETVAAVCSRSSRTTGDLREVLAKEYLEPFTLQKNKYGKSMENFSSFLLKTSVYDIFANPKSREFFIKWLAQYGDDSIAQMAGTAVVFPSISQIAIKHIENLRQGAAFLEQSTRYVDFSQKVRGSYKYYTDPTLKKLGLEKEYKKAMDGLFETYISLNKKLQQILYKKYPEENQRVLNAYIFDNIRSILPVATLGQMAMFASGQALEYIIGKSLKHNLTEIQWVGLSLYSELSRTIPAFLTRIEATNSKEYQEYLASRESKISTLVHKKYKEFETSPKTGIGVKIIDFDKNGENKIIAALLYKQSYESFEQIFKKVVAMNSKQKENILNTVLKDRKQRWYKLPRAFEFANISYEATTNIGAWRDVQRHRIKSQIRSKFSPYLGFEIPPLVKEENLEGEYTRAVESVEKVYLKIVNKDNQLAEYSNCLVHNTRYIVNTNLRAVFWETELRTIAQGHYDYRKLEQEIARLVKAKYPLIGKYLMADMNTYTMARRGTPEQIAKREKELKAMLKK